MTKTLRILRLLKLIRLLRVFRLIRYFSHLERSFRMNPSNLRFLQAFFVLMTTWHYIGCFYWLVAVDEYGGYVSCEVGGEIQNCFARECIFTGGCLITNTSKIFVGGYAENFDDWVPPYLRARNENSPISPRFVLGCRSYNVHRERYNSPHAARSSVYTDGYLSRASDIRHHNRICVFGLSKHGFDIDIAQSVLEHAEKSLKRFNLPSFFTKMILRYHEHMWSCPSDGIAELAVLPRTLKVRLSLVLNRELFKKIPLF